MQCCEELWSYCLIHKHGFQAISRDTNVQDTRFGLHIEETLDFENWWTWLNFKDLPQKQIPCESVLLKDNAATKEFFECEQAKIESPAEQRQDIIVLENILSNQTENSTGRNLLSQSSETRKDREKVTLNLRNDEWFKKDWKTSNLSQCSDFDGDEKENATCDKVDQYFSQFNDILLGKVDEKPSENFNSSNLENTEILPSSDIEMASSRSPIKNSTCYQSAVEDSCQECMKCTQEKVFSITSNKNKKNDPRREKTTEYHYLLERKAIRMMRRYYKDTFEDYADKHKYKYKQNMKRMHRSAVDQYIVEYIDEEFKHFPKTKDYMGNQKIWVALETIILCDRYKKHEPLTEGLDFDEIRQLLNKYSTKLLKQFLENSIHCFLFIHYYNKSSMEDAHAQKHVSKQKLAGQMTKIYDMCRNNFPSYVPSGVSCEVW